MFFLRKVPNIVNSTVIKEKRTIAFFTKLI